MTIRQARTALALVLVVVAVATMVALRSHPLPALLPRDDRESEARPSSSLRWKGRRLAFLVRSAHPPFSAVPTAGGEPCGLDVDVARAVADSLGVPAVFLAVASPELESRFLSGEGDVLLSSPCTDAANRRLFLFSAPYCRSRPALLVCPAESSRFQDGVPPEARISLLAGSFSGRLREGWDATVADDCHGWGELAASLREGRCDAALVDVLSAHYWLARHADPDLVLLPAATLVPGSNSVSMVVRKESADLARAIDGALWDMQRSGALRRLHHRYFPFDID